MWVMLTNKENLRLYATRGRQHCLTLVYALYLISIAGQFIMTRPVRWLGHFFHGLLYPWIFADQGVGSIFRQLLLFHQ